MASRCSNLATQVIPEDVREQLLGHQIEQWAVVVFRSPGRLLQRPNHSTAPPPPAPLYAPLGPLVSMGKDGAVFKHYLSKFDVRNSDTQLNAVLGVTPMDSGMVSRPSRNIRKLSICQTQHWHGPWRAFSLAPDVPAFRRAILALRALPLVSYLGPHLHILLSKPR